MISLFGGTFNPPHCGHIQPLYHAAIACNIPRVGLMPCKVSPLKSPPGVNDNHRVEMLSMLCQAFSDDKLSFYVENIELSLPSPSYTVKTLAHMRGKIGADRPMCFFLGQDSLYTLHLWQEWRRLLDYCHLIVLPRDSNITCGEKEVMSWVATHKVESTDQLHAKARGCIYHCQVPKVTVSSSELRTSLMQQGTLAAKWIPENVLSYIQQHRLYAN